MEPRSGTPPTSIAGSSTVATRNNGLVERYEKAKARFDEVTEAIAQRSAKSERLAGFIKTIRAQMEPVAEFDE